MITEENFPFASLAIRSRFVANINKEIYKVIVYTILRHIGNKTLPLASFDCCEKAREWAELQMLYLDKDWFYSVAIWETEDQIIIPCHDKRLRLVK